ncbi:porin [Adhaeribacter swui]|uniref:Porin n=1 Tax=Adhaeribacter swui TaxID=2086471 RepID=A0A7G7G868_9BACT|nr:porin [Adhaeribacter swui]QNF33352.1 porin [Adhaeribacter swui]
MFSSIKQRVIFCAFNCSWLAAFVFLTSPVQAQTANTVLQDTIKPPSRPLLNAPLSGDVSKPATATKSHWYDKIALRGYVQIRYNRLLESNPSLKSSHDASIGANGGFLIRRARLVFSGNVHDRVFIYIQPDLASTPSGSSTIHFAQIRDAYFDLALDKKKEYRLRIGQSKIPYGFENMQSSQNRVTLDRNDALNTAVPNERDLGMIFYWTPNKIRKRFSELANSSMKGSGDYGVFGLGIYNGQVANRAEANNNLHVVARISYPIALPNGQIIEPGIQGYTGKYTVTTDQLSSAEVKGGNFNDQRVAGSFVLYPKPFGFQMEYNIGKGPQFNRETNSILVKSLKGGYAQAMYQIKFNHQNLTPFVKAQYFEGGRKVELDARFSKVYETEFGLEWQPNAAFELATQYTITDRTTKDGKTLYNRQFGNLLRVQAQFNF